MAKYLTRDGENGAINTDSEITADVDRSAPGAQQPLADLIAEIWYAIAANIDTSADQGVVGISLGGDGLDQPAQTCRFPAFAAGLSTATIASVAVPPVVEVREVQVNTKGPGGLRYGLLTAGDDVLIATGLIGLAFPT